MIALLKLKIISSVFLLAIFFVFGVGCLEVKAQEASSTSSGIISISDADNDGLSDYEETNVYYTDPNKWDTDGDGWSDGHEILNGYGPKDPNNPSIINGVKATSTAKAVESDADKDGLSDSLEKALGTDPNKADTDGDGHGDKQEVYLGYSPTKGDHVRETDKRVEVDLTNQRMTYYLKGVKLGTILVSTGQSPLLTPAGDFKIIRKRPVVNYGGATYSYPNTKWNLEFKKGFYIHGAYWHNKFGKKAMSHGCVNVAYKDMENFYTFMDIGTPVKISGKTPSGTIAVNN